ncbi:amino acid ABC transporter permease [Bradyrhizobium zhanjiangense]|uniref:ABC transporter permease subunit n=1 Tax=Bradyrhizobium zhanjiangense TaxID=1325107 RepID=A0ABY0D9E1_9BRAD|nr:ABC transporter permease subunit [Bradyrhizobium zhanjiangense]RXG86641.1 ABC transporter permease subunit [Bradyrhizobium zhanjiangense]
MTWDWSYALAILPRLMVGIWCTILVTLASSAIALTAGLLLSILESVSTTLGRALLRFLLEVFRGVPILVLLYFAFYVLPEVGLTFPAMPVGIGVLGTVYAAFCSEAYRGSLITIPAELRDACLVLHLSPYTKWRRVLIPLMIKRAAPALLNYVFALFRASAFLFAIGVPVLLGEAQVAGYESFRYLEPFTLAGVFYMLMNLPFLYLLPRFKDKYSGI